MPQLPPSTTCFQPRRRMCKPSYYYRNFLHKHPHTSFLPSSLPPNICLCCDTLANDISQCTRCELRLCSSCSEAMTSVIISGDLHRLISHFARWKMGYSSGFLEREKRESQLGGRIWMQSDYIRSKKTLARGSGLRLEILPWMLWDEADEEELESDASDDSVYSDSGITTTVDSQDRGGFDGEGNDREIVQMEESIVQMEESIVQMEDSGQKEISMVSTVMLDEPPDQMLQLRRFQKARPVCARHDAKRKERRKEMEKQRRHMRSTST